MVEPRHTPGTWVVEEDNEWFEVHAVHNDGTFDCVTSGGAMGSFENHADAVLCAASPTLLKALEDLDQAYAGGDIKPMSTNGHAVLANARDAVFAALRSAT